MIKRNTLKPKQQSMVNLFPHHIEKASNKMFSRFLFNKEAKDLSRQMKLYDTLYKRRSTSQNHFLFNKDGTMESKPYNDC